MSSKYERKLTVSFDEFQVYEDKFIHVLYEFYLEYAKALLRKYSPNCEVNTNSLKTIAYILAQNAGDYEDVKEMLREIENDGIITRMQA